MQVTDVLEIVEGLELAGAPIWVDGGWCVDALVGRQLRAHDDLDIAVDRTNEGALRSWLVDHGFQDRNEPDDTASNFVATDDRGRSVDVHAFAFAADGSNTYGVEYPYDSLTGTAALGGVEVRCIAPEWMFRFKTAYPPKPKDLVDVRALAEKYGYDVPATHRGTVR
jgi:lincosamide nucleotidyltransferase A/C/D/E